MRIIVDLPSIKLVLLGSDAEKLLIKKPPCSRSLSIWFAMNCNRKPLAPMGPGNGEFVVAKIHPELEESFLRRRARYSPHKQPCELEVKQIGRIKRVRRLKAEWSPRGAVIH